MMQSPQSVIFMASRCQSFSLLKSTWVTSSVIFFTSQSYVFIWLTPGTTKT